MRTFVVAAAALAALSATPALARSDTHISFEFYSPAPVYDEPAPVYHEPAPVYYAPPVVYYPPVQHVYYAPSRHPCPQRWARGHGHHRHHHGYNRDFAWNDRPHRDYGHWRH